MGECGPTINLVNSEDINLWQEHLDTDDDRKFLLHNDTRHNIRPSLILPQELGKITALEQLPDLHRDCVFYN